MVMQKKASLLFGGKLGNELVKAHEEHKADETNFGQTELPPGIENGIFQLSSCKFELIKPGKENAGYPYFYAAGIVVQPIDFTDAEGQVHHVEGQRTSQMETICPTPNSKGPLKTASDHYGRVLNYLRLLGVDTKETQPQDVEGIAQALDDSCNPESPNYSPIYGKFRTWKGKPTKEFPNPRVNHQWNGVCELNGQVSPSETLDNSASPAPAETGAAEPVEATAETQVADQGEAEAGDTDLLAIAAAVDAGDTSQQTVLEDAALAIGFTAEQLKEAPDWVTVVSWIESAQAEQAGASDQAAAAEPEPASAPEPVAATPPPAPAKAAPKAPAKAPVAPAQDPKVATALAIPIKTQVKAPAPKPAPAKAAPAEWVPELNVIYAINVTDAKTKKVKKIQVETLKLDKVKKTIEVVSQVDKKTKYIVKWTDLQSPE